MGFSVLPAFFAHGVQGPGFTYHDDDAFQLHLDKHKRAWARRLAELDRAKPIAFPGWDDWDENGRLKPTARAAQAAVSA